MMVGRTIGSYSIIAKLGEGGMGEVYRARDTRLGRDVALNILPEAFASDPDVSHDSSARRERSPRSNHPHIAQVYGLKEGPAEAGPHNRALVMELVEGEDLSARIDGKRLLAAAPVAANAAPRP